MSNNLSEVKTERDLHLHQHFTKLKPRKVDMWHIYAIMNSEVAARMIVTSI